jgi:hypothetical protein
LHVGTDDAFPTLLSQDGYEAYLAPGTNDGDLSSAEALRFWAAEFCGFTTDAITLFDALPYDQSPTETLEQCSELLMPGGLLFLEVPNWGSRRATELDPTWSPRALHARWLFTDQSLRLMVEQARLQALEIRGVPVRVYQDRADWQRERAVDRSRNKLDPNLDLIRIVARRPADARMPPC